jgi:hypothetical protein
MRRLHVRNNFSLGEFEKEQYGAHRYESEGDKSEGNALKDLPQDFSSPEVREIQRRGSLHPPMPQLD